MKELIFLIAVVIMSSPNPQQKLTRPDSLIAEGARPRQAGTGYGFTEGASVAPDGRVFFTDQPNDRIYVWDETSGISLFKEGCGRANGTWFDAVGNLLACADQHNQLVKYTLAGETIVLLDHGFEGRHLNGPNDLWQDKKGGIYFTDPYYHRSYWEEGHRQLQEVQAVYYLKPTGELIRVIDDLIQPNGIVGTHDGSVLFVADIRGGTTWKYSIHPDGTLTDKTNFAPAGSDGMTLDKKGNVYLTFGKILVYNNKGVKIEEIELPESPSNLCFGGKDRKTLFITARTSVYTLKMKVRGIE